MLFFMSQSPYLQNRKVKREDIYVHNCFLLVFVGHLQERGPWVWKEVGGGGGPVGRT